MNAWVVMARKARSMSMCCLVMVVCKGMESHGIMEFERVMKLMKLYESTRLGVWYIYLPLSSHHSSPRSKMTVNEVHATDVI